jgi:hypothetical protein
LQLRLQLRAIASFGTKLRVCESQSRDPPVFFSKCPPFPWRMPGFGRAPTRPNGDVGYDPAGPPDGHGGWPGIGQWGGGRRCHPGGGMRPPKRHGMRNASVQKAPVRESSDGMAPQLGIGADTYAYRAQHPRRTSLKNLKKYTSRRRHVRESMALAPACRQTDSSEMWCQNAPFSRHTCLTSSDRLGSGMPVRTRLHTLHTCVRACMQNERMNAACCMTCAGKHKACNI